MRTLPFFLALLAISASAQPTPETGQIVGVVTDAETGEPLIAASVWLVDTTVGAAADLDGAFRIDDVSPGLYTLRATYVGYEPRDVTVIVRPGVTTTSHVRLVLDPDPALDCVIVCGERTYPPPGVYAARVVTQFGHNGSCCEPAVVRYDPPEVTVEDR